MTVGGLVGGANILTVLTGSKNTALYVGSIDGESITRREFEYERQIQINRTIQQGGDVNDQAMINAGNAAWNTIIENYIKIDPTALVESPKIGLKLPDTLSLIEIDQLISAINLTNKLIGVSIIK